MTASVENIYADEKMNDALQHQAIIALLEKNLVYQKL